MAKAFDVKLVCDLMRTKPGEAVFWSGSTSISIDTKKAVNMSDSQYEELSAEFSARNTSRKIAEKIGGKTLEMKMEENREALIAAGFPYDEEFNEKTKPAWEALSEAFAAGASGAVHLIYGMDSNTLWGDAEYNSIWHAKEYEMLKRNHAIIGVTVIDPFNQTETEYFPVPHDELPAAQLDKKTESKNKKTVAADVEQSSKKDVRFSLFCALLSIWFVVATIVAVLLQGEGYFLSRPLSWVGAIAAMCGEVYLFKRKKLLRANKTWFFILFILLTLHVTIIPILLNKIFALLLFMAVGLFLLRFVVGVLPTTTNVHITKRDANGNITTETKTYWGSANDAVSQAEHELRSEGYTDIKRN